MKWIALFISSTFFTGFLPGKLIGKPGVGGGLAGSIVGFIIMIWSVVTGQTAIVIFWMIIISLFLGLVSIKKAENLMLTKWGPRKRHTGEVVEHDFNQTNIDEVHGQFIASWPIFFFSIPEISTKIFLLLLSLVAFRIFDVTKPWPIKVIEKSSDGPLAIMLDDTAAGIAAALIVWGVIACFF